jgi:hypothetical protein
MGPRASVEWREGPDGVGFSMLASGGVEAYLRAN